MKLHGKTVFGITALCLALGAAAPLHAADDSRRPLERAGAAADDSVITGKVKAALLKDRDVKGMDITVETNAGVVVLAGTAENKRQSDRAAKIAEGVSGVKKVSNKIVIKGDDDGKSG
jgi:hyperosmotically inducible protein